MRERRGEERKRYSCQALPNRAVAFDSTNEVEMTILEAGEHLTFSFVLCLVTANSTGLHTLLEEHTLITCTNNIC